MSDKMNSRNIQLIRLLRRSNSLGLSQSTWEILRQNLYSRLGVVKADPFQASSGQPSPSRSIEALNTSLREKVNSGAQWREMEGVAWERLDRQPEVAVGASIVELAFMHGTLEDAGVALERVRKIGPDFYIEIHSGIRQKLCSSLWSTKFKGTIADLLFKERENPQLLPVEKRIVFQILANSKDPTVPWMFFRTNQAQILDESLLSSDIDLSIDSIRVQAARIGIDLGHDEIARGFLDEIPLDSPCREDALQLVCSINYESKSIEDGAPDTVVNLVRAESDWRERMRLLHGLLLRVRDTLDKTDKPGKPDKNRSSVNELLRNPLAIVPRSEEAWRHLSGLLVTFRDLEAVLPNMFYVFKQNATQFHSPSLDFALWVPFLDEQEVLIPLDKSYWTGVAKLHQYVAQGPKYESCLWQAREQIARSVAEWDRPVPVQWRELIHAATQACAASTQHFEYDRQVLMRQCRIAVDRNILAIGDVEDYLKSNDDPLLVVLNEFIEFAKSRKAESLEFRLIMIRSRKSHLTNEDVSSCWKMAVAKNCWDESWRAATILNARGALLDQVRFAWDICGEKRSRYGFTVPSLGMLQFCLHGFTPPIARLINACITVGHKLPELFAIINPNARAIKRPVPSKKSPEAEVENALDMIEWFPSQGKSYIFNEQMASVAGAQLPAFVNVLPQNFWTLVVLNICDRLGIHAWDWKLSQLSSMVSELVPRMTSVTGIQRQSSKVARWLRDLSPEERNAWQEIAGLSRIVDDAAAQEGIASFVCRVATVIYQGHFEALTSLQQMRAPVSIIWDLERWILSDEYSQIRKATGSMIRVPAPGSLQILGQIIKG